MLTFITSVLLFLLKFNDLANQQIIEKLLRPYHKRPSYSAQSYIQTQR